MGQPQCNPTTGCLNRVHFTVNQTFNLLRSLWDWGVGYAFYGCLFFCRVLLFGIYDYFFGRDCGSRPAGELLFCQQQQKSNQKNAATTATPL